MTETLLACKSVFIIGWLVVFLFAERARPASPWKVTDSKTGFSHRLHLLQNTVLWLINSLLAPLLIVLITVPVVTAAPSWRPPFLASFPGLMFDLVVLDLWIYGWHRANHAFPMLWRFHQVHHYDEQLDATSALRFHFGEVAISALIRAPVLFVLAIPLTSVVIFETLVAMAAIFHHSNIKLNKALEKILGRALITPSLHWVHHHAAKADTDSNYGTLLTLWDHVFSSLSPRAREANMVLGIEGVTENRLVRLLSMPFTSAVRRNRSR
jgi:sterol desaturase/sphingolipid hydroxylase (fatty acid hydroxylase superfamily)